MVFSKSSFCSRHRGRQSVARTSSGQVSRGTPGQTGCPSVIRRIASALAWSAVAFSTPCAAFAQSSVYAQNATISANAATISGQYMPVVTSGTASYYNFTTTITVNAAGKPSATTVFSPSPILLFNGLQAGNYVYPNKCCSATLSGPGIGPSGTTEWTWAASGNPFNAAFYVGPVSGNPLAARISKAGITTRDYSFGLAGGDGNDSFGAGCLLGIAQTGAALTIVSFSNSGCTQDFPQPLAQESWSLQSP